MEGSLAGLTDEELQAELAARQTAASAATAQEAVATDAPAEDPAGAKTPIERAQDALAVAQAQLADALTLLDQVGK